MARPCIYDADKVAEQLLEYIAKTDAPMIEEFLLADDAPCSDTFYRLVRSGLGTVIGEDESGKPVTLLSGALKKCHMKNVIHLERGVESGKIPAGWAAFKRKQPAYGGWTDKQIVEQETTLRQEGINVNIRVVE